METFLVLGLAGLEVAEHQVKMGPPIHWSNVVYGAQNKAPEVTLDHEILCGFCGNTTSIAQGMSERCHFCTLLLTDSRVFGE